MKEIKPQKYMIVSKEVEVDGAIELKDFVQETSIIEHKKDEFIQNKQNEIIMIEDEISRLQAKKSEIEVELQALTVPEVVK